MSSTGCLELDQDRQSELLSLVQNLIAEAGSVERLVECHYWSQEPGLVELIRAFLATPAEVQTALRAFFAAAVARYSVTASIDADGALILRSPEAAPILAALFGRAGSKLTRLVQ
ncbi:MAG: hypothetical protein R3D52_08660 [Xanthobacteraceae bacterium]